MEHETKLLSSPRTSSDKVLLINSIATGTGAFLEGRAMVKTKHQTEVDEYLDYETKVTHRAAHSLGCDPSDFNSYLVLEMWLDGLSQFEAATLLETRLQDECYYYLHEVK